MKGAYHASDGISVNEIFASSASYANANVTIFANSSRFTFRFGSNIPSPTPLNIPLSARYKIASFAHSTPSISEKLADGRASPDLSFAIGTPDIRKLNSLFVLPEPVDFPPPPPPPPLVVVPAERAALYAFFKAGKSAQLSPASFVHVPAFALDMFIPILSANAVIISSMFPLPLGYLTVDRINESVKSSSYAA